MTRKTILTCAVTGNITMPSQNPNLPITPRQIAEAALDAASAGAAIVHCHVRDPESAKGSMKLAHYEEVVSRIRDRNDELIINLTTGEGGRFVPSDEEPRRPAEGTTLSPPEARVAHVEALKPDICTLDFNTMWSGKAAVINTPRNLQIMAERIYAAGVRPEIELFDSGDVQMMNHFLDQGILRAPLMVQIVLGVRFGAIATPETLMYLRGLLPTGCDWAGFGIGRHAFPVLVQTYLLGGHVRIGMEDTVHIAKGELCKSNAQLVEKAVGLVTSLGGSFASAKEARHILGLSGAPA